MEDNDDGKDSGIIAALVVVGAMIVGALILISIVIGQLP